MFDDIADFGVFSGKPKTLKWREALSQRPSVRSAVAEDYADRLRTFIAAKKSHLSNLLV